MMKILGFDIKINNLSKKRPAAAELAPLVPDKRNTKQYIDKIEIYDRIFRSSIDIQKWRNALGQAESFNRYRRTLYKKIYEEIILDAHLTGVMNARINKAIGAPFKIEDEKGIEMPEITKLFQTEWFYDFLLYSMQSIFWGYSLIEFDDIIDDKFSSVELYPRIFVKPEFGVVTDDPWSITGYDYRQEPFATWHVWVGDECDLGLLNKAAPYVIMKRNALGAWAEYAEVFGMPIRWAKSPQIDKQTRAILQNDLQAMGKSTSIVTGLDTELTFIERGNSDSFGVYQEIINICNKEISKLILGQTMTTEDGSSKSQAQVHENVANDVARMDMRMLEFIVNDQLIPKMMRLGFKLKGLHFKFDHSEKISLTEIGQLTLGLVNSGKYFVPEQFIIDKLGIPVEKVELPQMQTQPFGDGGEKKLVSNQAKRTISTSDQVKEIYSGFCCHDIVNEVDNPFTEEEAEELIRKIYAGLITLKDLPKDILKKTLETLLSGVVTGFGGGVSDFELGSPDQKMVKALEENITVFSEAKTLSQVEEMISFLTEDGKVVPFNDFRKKALAVYENYNVNYLKTEYGVAVGQSRNANYWLDIEKNKETLPYLKYQTVGDGRVRPSHRALDGITRRVDDAFWKKYMPMNGWKCRCIVVQLGEAKETDLSNFKAPTDVPEVFLMNPGIEKVVFSYEHPYFKVAKRIKKKK